MRASLVFVALCACSPAVPPDKFVAGGGQVAAWANSPDGRVRVPLVAGLAWGAPSSTKESMVKVKADTGPTFVVAASIDDAPKPIALASCAEAHRVRLTTAATVSGVLMTAPAIDDELRRGIKVPRLHYAVPLEPAPGSPPASTLSSWTYFVDGSRCVGVGVTTLVKSKPGDPKSPDPEDLQRLERVFAMVAEGTVIASP